MDRTVEGTGDGPSDGPGDGSSDGSSDGRGAVRIRPLGRPGDLGWVVMAHGEVYSAEFGWDIGIEALVARIVADYAADPDPAWEAAWIAELDGRRAGCIFCVQDPSSKNPSSKDPSAKDPSAKHPSPKDPSAKDPSAQDQDRTAVLRILLVDQQARGHRLGALLVDTCLDFARQAGYRRMRLWTNHPLAAARRIYLDRGFTLTSEEPHHSFGVDLVGQTYELEFAAALRPSGAR
jgi:GNAT superfamily N-acetyltransferase